MEIFYVLLVLLLLARLFGLAAKRFDQPVLLGELVAGVLLGLVVHRFEDTFPVLGTLRDDEVFTALTELGIFFLMLMAGLELRLGDLLDAKLLPSLVAAIGVALPLAAGFGLGWWVFPASDLKLAQSLFLGIAMAITAVPVAAKVLLDLGALDSRVGRTIITAAIVDDVLGLGLLAVLTAVLSTGRAPDATELLLLAARIVAFFAITVAVGHVVFRRLGERIVRTNLEEVEFSALLIVALAFAVLAEVLGLHFILGAFMAGLMFVRRGVGDAVFQDVEGRVAAITQGFLAPVFFVSIGMSFEGRALGEVPGFVIVLVLTAFLVKAVAGLPALAQGLSAREAGAIGVGMSARGAVELVVADVALRAGLFAEPADDPIVGNLFSAVVVMAIVTTLAPSALLPWLLAGRRAEEDPSESS